MSRIRSCKSLSPLLLKHLREHGPCTTADLARALKVPESSVRRAMRELCTLGSVLRTLRVASGTAHSLWTLASDEDDPPGARVQQTWLGVGTWESPRKVPRTSVFDTRAFVKKDN